MKIFALAIGCTILTSTAGEVETREMYCDETKTIAKSLKDTHKEMPVITGEASDEAGSLMTIWMNPESESWTILATNGDYSCVIGVGTKLKVIPYTKKKSA